jgi:hypothetical protein
VLCVGCGCGGLFLLLKCYFLCLVVAAFLALVVAVVLLSEKTRSPQGNSDIFFLLWFLSLFLCCCWRCYCTTSLVLCVYGWKFGFGLFCGVWVEVVVVVGGKFLC